MDKQLLSDQIKGLKEALKTLRDQEKEHIKIQTLTEQIAKATVDKEAFEIDLKEVRAKKAKAKTEKAMTLTGVASRIADKVTQFLPSGKAIFQIDEDGLFLGLKTDEGITPYLSLSGGERAFFDLALCRALIGNDENNILIAEVAEVDREKLAILLKSISDLDPKNQIILNTCHGMSDIPDDWNIVQLGE